MAASANARRGGRCATGEIISRILITVGGIGTIVAIGLVCVFLVYKVYPLFLGAKVREAGRIDSPWQARRPLSMGVDEYQALGWAIFANGTLQVFRLDNGHALGEPQPLFPGKKLTACSPPSRDADIAFGFDDGSLQVGKINFATDFVKPEEVDKKLRDLPFGETAEFKGGIISRTSQGQLRARKIDVDLKEDPIESPDRAGVVLIDVTIRPDGRTVGLLNSKGQLRVVSLGKKDGGDLLAEVLGKEPKWGELDLSARTSKEKPSHLLVSGVGDNVFLAWKDGQLVRVSIQDLEKPRVVEQVNLLDRPGTELTVLQPLIGKTTLLAGDSSGRVRAWFRVRPDKPETVDGTTLVPAHELPGPGGAVTALAASSRSRLMAAGYADGRVRLFHVTSEKFLSEIRAAEGQPVQGLTFAPKEDGLLAETSAGLSRWQIDPRHPEATLAALFLPVWYEGSAKPEHVWQSSSGDDAFESKFGLWPLVFGTLKATFYAMLIGVPLALLAAVYTSEFLHPRAARPSSRPSKRWRACQPSRSAFWQRSCLLPSW